MEKWLPLLITTMIWIPTKNQENAHGCSYETMLYDGKQITCINITSAFFQYSNINLSRSQWLTCKTCNLSSIANDTFNFPKNTLSNLILIENNVMNISSSAFKSLPLLKFLSLRDNYLTKFNLQTFYGLTRLLQLDLSNNLLNKLEANIFIELENLDILNLNDNHIYLINPAAFAGLINLKYLYLNQNNIQKLEIDMFTHLTTLKVLYLENNQITEIHRLAFNNLNCLNYLYLNNNTINFLTQYNFKPLISLIDLQLRFNNLTEIDTSTFNGLKNIKFLYLGQNDLVNIRSYGFIGLNSLEVLDLIGNKFEYFSLDYFKDMENLNTLWLENNMIDNFTMRYYTQKQESLRILNLIENKLEFFNYKLLHEKIPRLEELWIGNNPWKCDFLIEMFHYFRNNNVSVCTSANCSIQAVQFYIESICFDPFQNEMDLTTEYVIDCTSANSFNFLLLVVLSVLIFCKYFIVSTSFYVLL